MRWLLVDTIDELVIIPLFVVIKLILMKSSFKTTSLLSVVGGSHHGSSANSWQAHWLQHLAK